MFSYSPIHDLACDMNDRGAAIAWRMGMHYPQRCHTIISVGNPNREPTTAYYGVEQMVAENPEFWYFLEFEKPEGDQIFSPDIPTQAAMVFAMTYDNKPGTSAEEKQYYIDSFSKQGFHGAINYYRSFRLNHEDDADYVGKPYTVPSLLIVVEKDPVLHRAYVESLSTETFVHLEKVYIAEGGHNVHTENPEALNMILEQYLEDFFGPTEETGVEGDGLASKSEKGDLKSKASVDTAANKDAGAVLLNEKAALLLSSKALSVGGEAGAQQHEE
ncbi:Bifunctional epoxide hydrolase 2 [Podila epigama]|nr:Bifunctional epoxide hydrolase 2 [Podila epigama]